MYKIGKSLKEHRKANKLTQQEVANLLSISRGAYTKYELDITQPDIKTIIKLVDIFKTNINELLNLSNDLDLSFKEKELLTIFQKLNIQQQDEVINFSSYQEYKNTKETK